MNENKPVIYIDLSNFTAEQCEEIIDRFWKNWSKYPVSLPARSHQPK